MIIQAELKRKQSEYEGEACVVDKVIELPVQRFQQFSRALLRPVQCFHTECPQSADTGYGNRPQLPFAGRALARRESG